MKAKHPETVWVVFKKGEPKIPLDSASYKFRFCDKKVHCQKPYHLHPGNEVARALNIIRGDVWYYNLNTTDKDVAEDLRNNGIPIRWNEKKGKFV